MFDLKYYFSKNKKIYLFFLFFFLIGIIFGILIAVSSDSYLSLLTTKDKVFFDYVNGKSDYSKETIKLILNFFMFQFIIFVLNLNYYSGLLSYVLVSYQSALMFLSSTALIAQYGFSGVMNTLFLSLPVNLILLVINILFSGICVSRSYNAMKMKRFSYGFDNKNFWLSVVGLIVIGILFSYLINLILVIILRKRIFIIF